MDKKCPFRVPTTGPFALDNLPFGVFSTPPQTETRIGVAVGDFVLDLSILEQCAPFKQRFFGDGYAETSSSVFRASDLGTFARLEAAVRKRIRHTLIDWLSDPTYPLCEEGIFEKSAFFPMKTVKMHMPFSVGGFTDFMCSDVHVENCSRLAGASVPPSHYAMPLCYNGRASSVAIDREPVHRPRGIIKTSGPDEYSFLPSQRMDYEAEIGFFISKPVPRGVNITADQAEDHIFGFVILNDWSARDIQFAEMTPLGPLNGKAFATSISPWVIPLEALAEARSDSRANDLREAGLTRTAHLRHNETEVTWNLEIEVSVYRTTQKKKRCLLTTKSNLRDLRWSPGQMVAHLASSGCGLGTGDLIGTGTISSPTNDSSHRTFGCLFELTEGGTNPAFEADGEKLIWLEDGDEVVMTVKKGGCDIVFAELKSQLQGCYPN
ncbi:putative 2-hydroxyhepta-2,4-diene-1,7-dioate isomerase [Paraphoma chrysanthemicola]|nr:putative 2-hydroxyhepta-2,4-diene-1,7-dioate isomerase [Paraphoma chrysanthemicola]